MAKLLDQARNAGMNSGATVLAKMKRLSELKRHPELESIFSIQPEILAAVAESMRLNGYDKAQPIVEGKIDGELYIVDGYTRYAAALQAGIDEAPVDEKEFESLEAAIRYCYKRQAERRNLKQIEIYNAAVKLNIPAQQIADELGVAISTVTRAKKIEREADPEDIEAIRNNKKTINSVYQKIKVPKDDGGKREEIDNGDNEKPDEEENGGETLDEESEIPSDEESSYENNSDSGGDILDGAVAETETNFGVSEDYGLPQNIKFLKSAVILLAEAGETKSAGLLVNHFLRKQERKGFLKLLPGSVSGKLANFGGDE